MSEKRLEVADLDEVTAVELVAAIGELEGLRTSATFIAKRFVGFLADQGLSKRLPPPTPEDSARAELRRDYEAYLRRQPGPSGRTIFHSRRLADRPLHFFFGDGIGGPAPLP